MGGFGLSAPSAPEISWHDVYHFVHLFTQERTEPDKVVDLSDRQRVASLPSLPGLLARLLGFVVRLIPKVGVLQGLAFKMPTRQTEDMYIRSVNGTIAHYRRLLHQVGNGNLDFPNVDCDTGGPTVLGEYTLTDETDAELLDLLVRRGLEEVPLDVQSNILAFYDEARVPRGTRKEQKTWGRTIAELAALRAGPGSAIANEVRQRLLTPAPRVRSPKDLDSRQ